MTQGFQDRLAELHDAAQRRQEQAERVAGRQRFEDYQYGQAIADDLIRRAGGCRSIEEKAATLRAGAAAQPDTLAGRVAASELSDAATVSARIAAARARRAERSPGVDRDPFD